MPEGLLEDAPLVVVLHGYGGNNAPGRFGLNATADRHGFAVCYPQGIKDHRGKTCWNVGYSFQADMNVDDVRFITQLVRHLQKEYKLSRRNVFCTGMSNGGDMCYLLAVRRPELFAAVAPVAGVMLEWFYKADTSKRPVPLFEIHGTADKTSLWEGDPDDKGGWGGLTLPFRWLYIIGWQRPGVPVCKPIHCLVELRRTAVRLSLTALQTVQKDAKYGFMRLSAGNIHGASRTSIRERNCGAFSADL